MELSSATKSEIKHLLSLGTKKPWGTFCQSECSSPHKTYRKNKEKLRFFCTVSPFFLHKVLNNIKQKHKSSSKTYLRDVMRIPKMEGG